MQTDETMDKISDSDILAYLEDNPDFLKRNPGAAELLVPAKDRSKGRKVADFQYYLVEKARKDKEDLAKQSQDIIETARSNMHNQNRIHGAVLKLLEAESFEDFIQTITMDLTAILNVDLSCLVVESNGGHDIAHMHVSGIRVVPEGTLDMWMGDKEAVLESDMYGLEEIYGGGAGLVRSQALLRIDISKNTPPAMLAFGAREPEMFSPGQGVELIGFLARIIERSMRQWLCQPAP